MSAVQNLAAALAEAMSLLRDTRDTNRDVLERHEKLREDYIALLSKFEQQRLQIKELESQLDKDAL